MENRLITIEDVSRVKRPKLGPNLPVSFWRMFILVVMPAVQGAMSDQTAYDMGYKFGEMVGAKKPEDINDVILGAGIGVTNPVDLRPGFLGIEFSECFTCSGITPPVGRPICRFEVGFVAGAVERGLGHKITSISETKCIGGLGHDVCRVEVGYEVV